MANFKKMNVDDATRKSVDLLLDNAFKRNKVAFKKPKLSKREKQEIRDLLKNLQDGVKNLTKQQTDK
ncbi:hypothetical protein [Mesobacillus harenae]|uniref:hypothetical protein n=1 Tax=Mesobacillus harenae TaxID=2213203 RepID=UPI0015804087|nr:hypothetical protein [Mesobacillus harenae]